MNIIELIKSKFKDKKLQDKIDQLTKEIEDVRELTTENYWKLKKELNKTTPKKRKVNKKV